MGETPFPSFLPSGTDDDYNHVFKPLVISRHAMVMIVVYDCIVTV